MGLAATQQKRLIGERVRALATILLTRGEAVSIHEVAEDSGLDLIVTIRSRGKLGLRQFGVELRGVWARVTAEHANAVLRPSMQQMLRYGPFPFPVALFFYTMEDGRGWYTWCNEPLILSNGKIELQLRSEAFCSPLDEAAVDDIIDRVNVWYDAFYTKISQKAPKRPS